MFEIYGFAPSLAVSGEQSSASAQYAQFIEVIYPEDVPMVEAALQRVIAKKSDGSMEFRLELPDGSTNYISVVERAVLDEHDNVARVIGVNMDVTERKITEAARRIENRPVVHPSDHYFSGRIVHSQCDHQHGSQHEASRRSRRRGNAAGNALPARSQM